MDFRAILMGLMFALMWSSAFTSARIIVADAPPLTALALRFLISGALGVAIALALGLGTRDVAGNIIAGVYARDLYEPGVTIRFGDVSGTVLQVTSTSVVVRVNKDKTITVPNSRLIDEQVEVLS